MSGDSFSFRPSLDFVYLFWLCWFFIKNGMRALKASFLWLELFPWLCLLETESCLSLLFGYCMSLCATGFIIADSAFLLGLMEYWESLKEFWRRAKNASVCFVVQAAGFFCLNCFSETLLAEKTYLSLSMNYSDFLPSLIFMGDLAIRGFF